MQISYIFCLHCVIGKALCSCRQLSLMKLNESLHATFVMRALELMGIHMRCLPSFLLCTYVLFAFQWQLITV